MEAVQLVSTFPPYKGGMGGVAYQIAQRWPGLVTLTPDYGELKKTQDLAVPVIMLRPLVAIGNGAVVPQVFFKLARAQYVLLHFPFFGAALFALLSRVIRRRQKLVIYYHHDLVPPRDMLRTVFFTLSRLCVLPLAMRVADRVAVSSLDYAAHSDLAPYVARWPGKFIEVPLGVDSGVFSPASDSSCTEVGARMSRLPKPVFVFVGGLDRAHDFKGVDVLLDAMAELRRRGTTASLAVVGDGDRRTAYEERVAHEGLSNHVAFLGGLGQSELRCLYSMGYYTVLPSRGRSEAFGLVLLESLACGTPVIASDLPGVRTLTDGGRTGQTVSGSSSAALADALAEAAAHPDLRLSRSLHARQFAAGYTWERVVSILQSL